MKSIAIKIENRTAIEAALKLINGKAVSHTFTTYAEVAKEAANAEAKVLKLVGSKNLAVGASVRATSGDSVPNAYKYTRVGTSVTLVRKSSGWHLAGVSTQALYKEGGKRIITLTVAQSDKAKADFAKQWHVLAVPGLFSAVPA